MWVPAFSSPRGRALVLSLVVLTVSSAGCLDLGADTPAAPEPHTTRDDPVVSTPPPADAAPPPEPGVLRIQGDAMLERMAQRFDWEGSGTLASPYLIRDLELTDTLLVFQDISYAVTLLGARLQAPSEGPALLLWNVTAFTLRDSTLEASDGPAVSLLHAAWSRIENSRLTGTQEAVRSLGSEAIDLLHNDLHAGTTAIRFESDEGDHWIEGNRIHKSDTGIVLDKSARSSSFFDNTVSARTGLVLRDTFAPLLDANRIDAHHGIRLEGTHDATILDTTLITAGTALTVHGSHRLLVEEMRINATGPGVHLDGSSLSILANLSYEGPGPAISDQRSHMPVVIAPHLVLPDGEGEAIRMHGSNIPTILDGEIAGGSHAIRFDGTHEGAIIGTRIGNVREAAIVLDATHATVVADTWLQAILGNGITIEGGTAHQVTTNRLEFIGGTGIRANDTTDLDAAFNTFTRGSGTPIHIASSIRPLVEGNTFEWTGGGIDLQGTTGAVIHGNAIDEAAAGLKIARSADLQITQNHITSSRQQAILLDQVDGVVLRANALYSGYAQARGLILTDVAGGLVYDNYFDNQLNVVAAGTLDVVWHIAPQEGTNIAGGGIIAGNWWSDYAGADADGDGIGELPHGVLPYDEQIGPTPIPNHGVEDDLPIVSEAIPEEPVSAPDPTPVRERLMMLFGQHDALDRMLASWLAPDLSKPY